MKRLSLEALESTVNKLENHEMRNITGGTDDPIGTVVNDSLGLFG
ncbi:MAG: hypothetical protein AAF090_09930 [Bacteroidota bacterium]